MFGPLSGAMNYNTSITQGGLPSLGSTPATNPRSARQQMFNLPAYMRKRVTGDQMGELERANQDRYAGTSAGLRQRMDRENTQLSNNQAFNSMTAAQNASNQYQGLMNNYLQGANRNAMTAYNQDREFFGPMLSQILGGIF
jgi:hypothetical protein